ncbi:hypothetical protein HLV40_15380 [Chromohalobacter salexigens]|nr:hypothetical protein [Chromohalobacter salexigens]
MQIKESQVTKITVTGAEESYGFTLDPISIYLEDYGQGKGKLTVGCWDATWSYYWGAMGDRSLVEFIIGTNNGYLANKLKRDGEKFSELDIEALEDQVRKEIVRDRREGTLGDLEARELWDRFEDMDFEMPFHPECEEVDYLYKVLGTDCLEALPERTSAHGRWLWDILSVVREVLRQRVEAKAA